MVELHTEIEINATPQRIWDILSDLPSYPEWNPFIRSIKGTLAKGSRIKVDIYPPDGKPMTFTPTVQEATPNRELRWLGKVGITGIFNGAHAFIIEEHGEKIVRFIQKERFTGILVPFLRKNLEDGTYRGFVAMNEALKKRAEE